MSRKRIGELLVERNAITKEQLEAGLAAQKRTRQRLGVTLIQQGLISEVMLAQVLAQSLELATVDLAQVQVDWSAVHMLRARFCENHELFPFAIEGKGTANKRLMVALSDPLNQNALEEIEFTTGLKVAPYVSTHSQIRAAILRYYHKVSEAEAAARAPIPPPPPPDAVEDEPPMVMGEEIISVANKVPATAADPALEKLIQEKQSQSQARRKAGGGAVSKDLDFLFGGGAPQEDEDPAEKMERRFWALMRIMARKGLITREEFLKELEGEQ